MEGSADSSHTFSDESSKMTQETRHNRQNISEKTVGSAGNKGQRSDGAADTVVSMTPFAHPGAKPA